MPQTTNAPRLVEITPHTHDVALDIRYATADNITGEAIYGAARLFLRPEAETCLKRAAGLARAAGFSLVLFDGYRPVAAQAKLWAACPDERYVCPPHVGSTHTRGIALDLTLARHGRPLDMGTPFDDMSEASHPASTAIAAEALRNRLVLAGLMGAAGFEPIKTEWWHFQLPGEWPLLEAELLPGGERALMDKT